MKKKIAFITALILVTIQFTAISVIPSSADDIVSWRTYYLRNAYSGKYLYLTSNGTINGTEVQQYDFGYPSELFNVRVQSDGYWYKAMGIIPSGTPGTAFPTGARRNFPYESGGYSR